MLVQGCQLETALTERIGLTVEEWAVSVSFYPSKEGAAVDPRRKTDAILRV